MLNMDKLWNENKKKLELSCKGKSELKKLVNDVEEKAFEQKEIMY